MATVPSISFPQLCFYETFTPFFVFIFGDASKREKGLFFVFGVWAWQTGSLLQSVWKQAQAHSIQKRVLAICKRPVSFQSCNYLTNCSAELVEKNPWVVPLPYTDAHVFCFPFPIRITTNTHVATCPIQYKKNLWDMHITVLLFQSTTYWHVKKIITHNMPWLVENNTILLSYFTQVFLYTLYIFFVWYMLHLSPTYFQSLNWSDGLRIPMFMTVMHNSHFCNFGVKDEEVYYRENISLFSFVSHNFTCMYTFFFVFLKNYFAYVSNCDMHK